MTSDLSVRAADSVDELGAQAWDGLCGPGDYFTADYLRALTAAGMDCVFRFYLASSGGEAVGLALGYRFSPPIGAGLKIRVFSTGSPVDIGFPFRVRDGADRNLVMTALVDAVIADARELKAAAVLMRDVVEESALAGHEQLLASRGLRKFPLFAEAILPTPWPSFDGYLGALRKRYRNALKHNVSEVAKAGFEFEVVPGGPKAADLAAEIQPLWMQVYKRHPEEFDQLVLPEAYFREVLSLPESALLTLRKDGRVVAFDQVRGVGRVLDSVYCGREYSALGRYPIGHMLIAETIRYACDNDFDALSFGLSNEAVKSRYGCGFRVVHAYRKPLALPLRIARVLGLERFMVRGYDVDVANAESSEGHVFKNPANA